MKNNLLWSGGVGIILFIGMYSIQPFMFLSNDDRYISDIAIGAFTGNAEYFLICPEGLFGYIIFLLQKLVPTISWFGVIQVCMLMFSFSSVLYSISKQEEKKIKKILGSIIFILVSNVAIGRSIYLISWTITAGVMACAALIYFFYMPNKLNVREMVVYNIPTYIMVFFSFSLRANAFLMMCPLAIVIGIYKLIIDGKERINIVQKMQIVKYYTIMLLPIILIITVIYSSTFFLYRSEEWKNAMEFYKARVKVVDYHGYPIYEENKGVYESLNISSPLYEALNSGYMLLFADIDAKALEQLAEVSDELYNEKCSFVQQIWQALSFTLGRWKNDQTYILPQITIFSYLIIMGVAILLKKWRELGLLMGVWTAHVFTWTFLVYRGRFPEQVVYPLYAAEILMLYVIALALWKGEVQRKKLQITLILATVLFIVGYALGGSKIIRSGIDKAQSSQVYYENLFILEQYCAEHNENIYFIDDKSMTYFKSPALQIKEVVYQNYIPLGGWSAKSPLIDIKLERSGINDPEEALMTLENSYMIFNGNEHFDQSYLWNYLSSKYDYAYELVDEVICSSEVIFHIYKVKL